ncbi:MAG: WsbH [candidate division WS6 bacterium GW2011_GWA2_37_6]|uniref:WsbH n=1 Tax=candidate division WS6 bacterium GW2011_GWA2_37_6 TaxID=1619087 RepID=A0A0G0HB18_9BACT|nr:MAG: WsbH [candidate division WS6 bacterium GW2011_GWA2_37_6]
MKILLTTHHLKDFAGSELNTYDLALQLRAMGHKLTIATFQYQDPIRSLFEKEKLDVVNLLEKKLSNKKYDLIWAQHFIVLNYVLFVEGVSAPKVVYRSLSNYEPLEYPPSYTKELSLCLAISKENKDFLLKEGFEKSKIVIFPNSVREEFFTNKQKANKEKITSIMIASNHIPTELLKAVNLLRKKRIKVDIYGLGHKFEHITPSLLGKYDVVVSIGRTVQYALAMGKPIFCYDRFGGPGYITNKNFEAAEKYNFSGRGFDRIMDHSEITSEIINNYSKAIKYSKGLKDVCQDKFSLQRNASQIFNRLEKSGSNVDLLAIKKQLTGIHKITEIYASELRRSIERDKYIQKKEQDISEFKVRIKRQEKAIKDQSKIINQLKERIASTIEGRIINLKRKVFN